MAEKKEITKVDIPLKIGDSAVFEKTITETDVVLFGGLTGDYSQMHFNEEYMKKTMYGTRIAHGILTFAIGCTASTKIQEQVKSPVPSASYGYDKLRFINPVYFGDTLTWQIYR
ncbi:MaoC family dehydratase N-terminal domain-containing protein [[Clostridium] innocuum]|nr:MaoC family dehydratase N-terminal domain-containing protein [[Clostridium] innocuum]